MKIVHCIYSLSSGGAERMVVNLCNEQVRNHEVVLVLILKNTEKNSFYLPDVNANVKIIHLNSNKGFKMNNFWKFNRILKAEKPNVVHFHLNTVVYGFIPSLFSKIKFVHTLHSIAELSTGFKGQKHISKLYYKSGKILPIALSKECVASVNRVFGIKDVPFIFNGVPIYKLKIDPSLDEWFNSIKNNEKSIVFIHVARYNQQKNQALLFECFKAKIKEDSSIHLLVVGRDFPEIKEENIHMLGEISNPLDFICRSHAMVLSSFYEGIPVSVLEAMSCGIPILSTPAGGMIDIINQEINGRLSKEITFDSFYAELEKMIDLLKSDYFKNSEIKKHFQELYSIEKCAELYMKLYLK